jgi:hypothetical protein
MTTEHDSLAYKFEVADEIQVYRARPVKRYMICPAGGYYAKLELLKDGALSTRAQGRSCTRTPTGSAQGSSVDPMPLWSNMILSIYRNRSVSCFFSDHL